MTSKFPLFITRYSLSARTAIGVQTTLLLEPYPRWQHFHWSSNELKRQDIRSHRLETMALSRWAVFNRDNILARGLRRLGASRWENNQMRPHLLARLVTRHRDQVSVIYLAPLDDLDAARMKQLVQAFDRPFVLHLWDMFDGPAKPGGSLEWLIMHAEAVFCLSKPIWEEVSALRPDADYLLFQRKPASVRATAPQEKRLRIALIGHLGSYTEGLNLLHDALELLPRGFDIQVRFIGPPSAIKRLKLPIAGKIRAQGFARTDTDRDRALSECHIAFLPGPFDDPARQRRSKYSVPSRVLDFFALGLPIVGTVHPSSATADLFRDAGITEGIFCRTASEVAASLERLLDPSAWNAASAAGVDEFGRLSRESQTEKLRAVLLRTAQEGASPGGVHGTI